MSPFQSLLDRAIDRESRQLELVRKAVESGEEVFFGVWGPTGDSLWLSARHRDVTFDRRLKDGDMVKDRDGRTFIVRATPPKKCGGVFAVADYGYQVCTLPHGHVGKCYTDFLTGGP